MAVLMGSIQFFNSLLFSNEEKQALKIKVGIAPDDFVLFCGASCW
jgi:hypothetical protein